MCDFDRSWKSYAELVLGDYFFHCRQPQFNNWRDIRKVVFFQVTRERSIDSKRATQFLFQLELLSRYFQD